MAAAFSMSVKPKRPRTSKTSIMTTTLSTTFDQGRIRSGRRSIFDWGLMMFIYTWLCFLMLILILIMTSIQERLKENGRRFQTKKLTKRRIGTTTHHHHPVSRVSTRHCPQRRIRRSTSKRGIIIIRRRDCLYFHQQITFSDL